jgi:hypothetical protein
MSSYQPSPQVSGLARTNTEEIRNSLSIRTDMTYFVLGLKELLYKRDNDRSYGFLTWFTQNKPVPLQRIIRFTNTHTGRIYQLPQVLPRTYPIMF